MDEPFAVMVTIWDDWIDIPETDLQVRIYGHDLAGTLWIRKKPDDSRSISSE